MAQLYKRKGGEVLVNTETLNGQSGGAMALLPGGGFVVVWTDGSMLGGDTSGFGVKAQLFDASGNKVGAEFLVNATTAHDQYGPSVATLPSGRFVVTWTEDLNVSGDVQQLDVHGRIFEANGTPVGGEFLVNTVTAAEQFASLVTELSGGGFVAIWLDLSEIDSTGFLIKGQRFDASGAKAGGEFLISPGGSTYSVLGLPGGGFAVAWNSGEAKLQLFDANAVPVTGVQTVSAADTGVFTASNINALGSGFIVTWAQQDNITFPGVPNTYDLHAQRYDPAGNKVGAEILVNTTRTGSQTVNDAHELPGGGFIIVWQGPAEGTSDINIYGQVFAADGSPAGGELIVTTTTAGNQTSPKVEVLASGDIVVTYTDSAGDASGSGVRMQVLTLASNDAPTDIAVSDTTISEVAIENLPVATLSATMGALNSAPVYTIVSDETGGAFRIDGDKLVVADSSKLDFETNPGVDVRIRVTDSNGTSYEETITLSVENAVTETRYAAGDEVVVNTATAGFNVALGSAALTSGGFVVLSAWSGTGGSGLRVHILDAAGHPAAPERNLVLNTFDQDLGLDGLPGGGFVIAWRSVPVDVGGGTFGMPIHVQRFDAAGNAVGADLIVSTTNDAPISDPTVATLSSGGFVVTWTLLKNEEGTSGPLPGQIMARLYGADGQPSGAEFRVNTGTDGQQSFNNVEALPGGGFVVTWIDAGHLEGQRFDASGNKVGGELTIATGADQNDTNLAVLTDGSFVVSWAVQLVDDDVSIFQTFAQHVGANGVNIGGPVAIAVNATTGVGTAAMITATADGGFVATWNSLVPGAQSEDDFDSFARFFDASGTPIGDIVTLGGGDSDQFTTGAYATLLASGAVAMAWTFTYREPDGDANNDIAARVFVPEVVSTQPTPGPDTLTGTPNADTIDGLGGNDVINGLGGDDILIGGLGADTMAGGLNDDTYFVDNVLDKVIEAAGEGYDTAYTSVSYALAANVSVEVLSAASWGGLDPLALTGNALGNTVYGNAGDNVLDGGGGADVLNGQGGHDVYFLDNVGDVVVEGAGGGFDTLFTSLSYTLGAGVWAEILSVVDWSAATPIALTGNELANRLYGNAGANVLTGNDGDDWLTGFGGGDTLVGGQGEDVYWIWAANDGITETAGRGYDTVYAFTSYTLGTDANVEVVSTYSWVTGEAINLTGNALSNVLFGNIGSNVLNGGLGADRMTGFAGADTFAFTTALGTDNADTIVDFVHGTDKIALDDAIFAGIGAPGSFSANAFVTGAAAADADDRVVYNSATGQLFYDADGSGAGAAVLFATLSGNPTLSASDFMVI